MFLDEQGDATFAAGASSYFGLCAVTTDDPTRLCWQVDGLRHRLWAQGHIEKGFFHCSSDCRIVQREMFDLFPSLGLLRLDAVSVTKEKVHPALRHPSLLYGAVAGRLMRFVARQLTSYDELIVVLARWQAAEDIALRFEEATFHKGRRQSWAWAGRLRILEAEARVHPGIQVADYAAWAAHRRRKYEEHYWWSKVERSAPEVTDFLAF